MQGLAGSLHKLQILRDHAATAPPALPQAPAGPQLESGNCNRHIVQGLAGSFHAVQTPVTLGQQHLMLFFKHLESHALYCSQRNDSMHGCKTDKDVVVPQGTQCRSQDLVLLMQWLQTFRWLT